MFGYGFWFALWVLVVGVGLPLWVITSLVGDSKLDDLTRILETV